MPTLLIWLTLKPAEFFSSMLPWIWPIGMAILGPGQGMPRDGENGTAGFLQRTKVFGRSTKLVYASPYLCLICPRMNLFDRRFLFLV
jgi:hypothetical protein